MSRQNRESGAMRHRPNLYSEITDKIVTKLALADIAAERQRWAAHRTD